MFVDELEIYAKAGDGGDGVVRWRREKYKPKGGPAGGNGGDGGAVFMRAVRDLSLLSKYTGIKDFTAKSGESGHDNSKYGKNGEDFYIDVPVGATVTDLERNRTYVFETPGQVEKILLGGQGGLGNEYFKSSTNRAPEQSTKGKKGEDGKFLIELALVVDVGFIGFPNAGKSTLLNTLTNATARVGAYPFTTLEPHLGDLYGYILADIPGLIEGASEGKGLGHKFLRHIQKTKMLVHCISLENEDVVAAYRTIATELSNYDKSLTEKSHWVVLTKSDLTSDEDAHEKKTALSKLTENIFVLSAESGEGVGEFQSQLSSFLDSKS